MRNISVAIATEMFRIPMNLAEGEGFEPPDALTSPAFKAGAFGRSANPPGWGSFCPVTAMVLGGSASLVRPNSPHLIIPTH